MKTLILSLISVVTISSSALAQQAVQPVIIVVDSNKASAECNACKVAIAQLKQQASSLETLRAQLAAPIESAGMQLQQAVEALKGAEPDAALKAKIGAFREKEERANSQLTERARALERNQSHVLKQVQDKMAPAVEAVRASRSATVVMDTRGLLSFAPALDVTTSLIAELNRTLASINTTAPATAGQGR